MTDNNPHEQILQLLITGGFLDPGKLKEARDIIGKCAPSPVSGSLEMDEYLAGISDSLKDKISLRARNENLVVALKAYVKAQGKMLHDWSEGDDSVKNTLWKNLHACEDFAREVLENNPPSFNKESFLKALREGNPYDFKSEHDYDKWRWNAYANAVQKAKELLNQSK